MPLQPRLCPLSLAFSLKQQQPSILSPGKVDVNISIGFPCLKEKCLAYEEVTKWCTVINKEIE